MKTILFALKNFIRTIGNLISPQVRHLPTHCSNINSLLLHLCDYDRELHQWVLRWIALPLRKPGVKMSTALMVNGSEGTGKSLFFDRIVSAMYGAGARHIEGQRVSAAFNSWAAGARYVVIEGEYSKRTTVQLKELVSSRDLIINTKGAETTQEPNQMNFVFITGGENFLPLSAASRRFAIVEAPPAQDSEFYRAVVEEMKNGGLDAFHLFLLSALDMGDFDENTMPPQGYRAKEHSLAGQLEAA